MFCRTFASDSTSRVSDIFIMILVLFMLFCCLAVLSWAFLKLLFPRQPKLQVMGLFGCLQKTVSRGLQLEMYSELLWVVCLLTQSIFRPFAPVGCNGYTSNHDHIRQGSKYWTLHASPFNLVSNATSNLLPSDSTTKILCEVKN